MMRTFIWMIWRAWRNRSARRLRRIREPRYALALIVGLAYFWFIFFTPGRSAALGSAPMGGTAHLLYALGLTVLAASWWLMGQDRLPFYFAPAEVQLLFPAPIARRQLVTLKILQAQLPVLFSCVLWMIILGPGAGPAPLRAVGLWVLFTALFMHRMAAWLVRTSIEEHGVAGARRSALAVLIVGGTVAAAVWSVAEALPAFRAALAASDPGRIPGIVLHLPIIRIALYPARLLLAPVFAHSVSQWLGAIWPAALVALLHFPWVLRTDTAFEEAAAEASARRAMRLAQLRGRGVRVRASGRRGVLGRIPLAPRGARWLAIVWKNGLALLRTTTTQTIIAYVVMAAALLLGGLSLFEERHGLADIVAFASLVLAGGLVFLGPIRTRNDLRLDLPRLEMLRALPLGGRVFVRAEIAASLIVLSAAQMALVLVGYAAAAFSRSPWASLSDRTALLVAALLGLPAVSALGLVMQNTLALLFPAWIRLGMTRPGGVEAMGQGIVNMLGSVLAVLLLLLPPLVAGVAISALTSIERLGFWALLPGVAAGAAIAAGEVWLITAWLGRVFDRTEPLPPELLS